MLAKMRNAFQDPPFRDPSWQAYILDLEETSALAPRDWSRFRAGLRQVKRRHEGRVPTASLHRDLAKMTFMCAAHWGQTPRVVRGALRAYLKHPLDTRMYSYMAAEYWQWAYKVSPADLPAAEAMLAEVREYLPSLDDHERRNTEGLLAFLERQRR
ncbi:hypothetical protein EJ065_0087 [Corallococcus coralloides]|uniref:Uncharacterized protein n=2 Tax=Corallococcus coralloides TaxID=184914 RepID=A0A410RID3_CORCK|nr:hypothetical protein EJ065_0087 [Corallococcus coralloides]